LSATTPPQDPTDDKSRWEMLDDKVKGMGATLPFAGLLTSALGNFRVTTERTTAAFVRGDTVGGCGGIAEMLGSITPLIAIGAGPSGVLVSSIIGGFLSILGAVLTSLEPQRNTLRKELDEALDRLHAKLIRDELRAAEEDFIAGIGTVTAMDDKSRTWEQLQTTVNLAEGNATHQLNVSKSWLREEQKNPQWAEAFKLYWEVASLRTQYFALALSKLVEQGDAQRVGMRASQNQLDRDRGFARELYAAALDAGRFWHVGTSAQLYARDGLLRDGSWDRLGLSADEIAVGADEMLYGLKRGDGVVWAGRESNRIRINRTDAKKVIGMSLLPIGDSNLSDPNADDVLFLLLDNGHTLLVETIDRQGKTKDLPSLSASARRLKFNGIDKLRQVLTGFAGLTSARNKVTKFQLLMNDDEIIVADIEWNMGGRAWGDFDLKRFPKHKVPGTGKVLSIASNARHLYAHTESKIQRAPLDPAAGLGAWELIPSPEGTRGKRIESIAVGRDGQLLALFGDRIWARNEPSTDKPSWAEVKNADAYRVAKRVIDGFAIPAGYLATQPVGA
jgi:hypothetical protein